MELTDYLEEFAAEWLLAGRAPSTANIYVDYPERLNDEPGDEISLGAIQRHWRAYDVIGRVRRHLEHKTTGMRGSWPVSGDRHFELLEGSLPTMSAVKTSSSRSFTDRGAVFNIAAALVSEDHLQPRIAAVFGSMGAASTIGHDTQWAFDRATSPPQDADAIWAYASPLAN